MNNTLTAPVLPSVLHNLLNLGLSNKPTWNYDTDGTTNNWYKVPVNVAETDAAYELSVLAAGRNKADFSVTVDKDLLTIQAVAKEHDGDDTQAVPTKKILRTEYGLGNFKRTFTLTEHVDATNISATYTNGVLLVTVPKKEIVKVMPTTIEIQ